MSPLVFDRIAKEAAEGLGAQITTLRKEVEKRRPSRKEEKGEGDRAGSALVLPDPDPWPGKVGGAELLDEIVKIMRRYLILPDSGAEAIALWSVYSYAHDLFDISPSLIISSPVKRCGKTQTIKTISEIVSRPLTTSNISTSAIFRVIEVSRPTLLMDEAENYIHGDNEDMCSVLNSGHTRATAFVVRTVGDDHEPRKFSTYTPMVIALIGKLTDTLEDRGIIVRMQRRRSDERVERFRESRVPPDLLVLGRKAARWIADHQELLREADPQLPDGLDDRAQDKWFPLVAIADLAGGEWPERARDAALALSGEKVESADSAKILLLEDLRDLFEKRKTNHIFSADICVELAEMEDRPWPEHRKGKPITPRQLSILLKHFEISPKSIRIGLEAKKGYDFSDFEDAFSRYIPPSNRHTVTTRINTGNPANSNRHTKPDVTDRNSGNPAQVSQCDGVTDRKGGEGQKTESGQLFSPETEETVTEVDEGF